MPQSEAPIFSFVLPVFNEEMNVEALTQRLCDVGENLGETFEIVWVNDGSTDGTDVALEKLGEADPRVRPIHLSRNFGHMAALTAGLECANATGAVVCLDGDGQHPPEVIPDLVARWKSGADIVQTVKESTGGETAVERLGKRIFCAFLKYFGELDLPQGASDFRLMSREVVDALNGLPEHVRFVRGLVYWVGYEKDVVRFEAPARIGGQTKYSLRKLASMALNGITSFSTRPLRLSFLLGALVTLLGFLYGAYILYCFASGQEIPKGWPSTLLTVLFLGGIQLMTIGILSEYLARLYTEVKQRPVYLVRKKPKRAGR